MLLLAIETTCDETAAAVVDDALRVRSSVVASQESLHDRFRGVVPEIAARAHVEQILTVIDQALSRANVTLSDVDLIAVCNTPGLAGSLLVGVMAAKGLALGADKPLIAVNHVHCHIYACQVTAQRNVFPCVGLVVSGGHTNLYHCESPTQFRYLGGTIDDAAGEAFDKVAAMLGLGYPGGPLISKHAEPGNPKAYRFPRSFLGDDSNLDFSFSGLKTAVRYVITKPGQPLPTAPIEMKLVCDISASFQEAVVDCLIDRCQSALRKTGLLRLCVGGGVASNRRIRERLNEIDADVIVSAKEYCTDNAVMAALAFEKWKVGELSDLALEILPGLERR